MVKKESVEYGRLLWRQTGFGARDFELMEGDALAAVLYWPKFLSQRAVAECSDGKWYLDRIGFLRQQTVAIDAGSGAQVASFQAGWLGDGDLTLSNGRVYRWYRTKCLGSAWALVDAEGNAVLEISVWMHWFKHRADVILRVPLGSLPEMPLLILFCWYIGFMSMQDAAAVAATAAC